MASRIAPTRAPTSSSFICTRKRPPVRGSFFVEYPYRQLNPLFSPTQAGFSDINFGIKSMWLDTELLQVTFQFRTYTPSGNAAQGLGTGHFSLDPSVMASMKLAPRLTIRRSSATGYHWVETRRSPAASFTG